MRKEEELMHACLSRDMNGTSLLLCMGGAPEWVRRLDGLYINAAFRSLFIV